MELRGLIFKFRFTHHFALKNQYIHRGEYTKMQNDKANNDPENYVIAPECTWSSNPIAQK